MPGKPKIIAIAVAAVFFVIFIILLVVILSRDHEPDPKKFRTKKEATNISLAVFFFLTIISGAIAYVMPAI
jgi:hypothetical protein